ncbi:MAG TPA: hypothetical protein VL985_14925 [Stellaceae bacterium]|nr:hypothetical protein [Stellaceae bacterium]
MIGESNQANGGINRRRLRCAQIFLVNSYKQLIKHDFYRKTALLANPDNKINRNVARRKCNINQFASGIIPPLAFLARRNPPNKVKGKVAGGPQSHAAIGL